MMKHKKNDLNIFISITGLILAQTFTFQVFAQGTPAAPAASGLSANYYDQIEAISSCPQMRQSIPRFCSGNVLLGQVQSTTGTVATAAQNAQTGGTTGTTENINAAQAETAQSMAATAEINRICRNAAVKCQNLCNEQIERASAQTPPNQAEITQAQQSNTYCENEYKTTTAKVQAAQMSLNEVMQSLLALKELLGLGGSDADAGLSASSAEDDPCEGENADSLLMCTGQSDPKGTRADLNSNLAGLNGDPSLTSPLQTSEMGDPGGVSKSSAGGSGSGGGFGAGMAPGMMGMGSGLGSSSSGESDKASGLNADINRGFMSGGGGSSGGGGGGGGYSASSKPYAGYSAAVDADAQKAALNKKLGQYANEAGRGLASTDGTNGPTQDIWSVVNQSYKKNSNSLYHQ